MRAATENLHCWQSLRQRKVLGPQVPNVAWLRAGPQLTSSALNSGSITQVAPTQSGQSSLLTTPWTWCSGRTWRITSSLVHAHLWTSPVTCRTIAQPQTEGSHHADGGTQRGPPQLRGGVGRGSSFFLSPSLMASTEDCALPTNPSVGEQRHPVRGLSQWERVFDLVSVASANTLGGSSPRWSEMQFEL